jgi:pimeloyl-ACP methyl ester carboxylesterase
MASVTANGMTLEIERHGPATAEPLVLIRGLGSQLIHWPDEMISGFVAAGFHVVTFDNRDAGLSQKCDDAEGYGLRDMAEDTVGLMDALGLGQAHVLGLSMGGMILQLMALHHPERILSATIVMSSGRAPGLPQADPELREMLRSAAPSDRRADVVAHELATGRAFQSPRWPFDAAERAALIGRAFDRCHCPEGTARQYAAMMRAAPDLSGIDAIAVPTLVVHGTEDRLLPPAHGRDIAARIPGAELIEIDGMGHDISGGAVRLVTAHVTRFLSQVAMRSRALKK